METYPHVWANDFAEAIRHDKKFDLEKWLRTIPTKKSPEKLLTVIIARALVDRMPAHYRVRRGVRDFQGRFIDTGEEEKEVDEKTKTERVVAFAEWLIKNRNLSRKDAQEMAFRLQKAPVAKALGASPERMRRYEHQQVAKYEIRKILANSSPEKIQKAIRRLAQLKEEGYDFSLFGAEPTSMQKPTLLHYLSANTKPKPKALEMFAPLFDFLIRQGQDPRDSFQPGVPNATTPLTLARSDAVRNYLMQAWKKYKAGKVRGEIEVQKRRLERGEFAPGMPITTTDFGGRGGLTKAYLDRAVHGSVAEQVCQDIDDNVIPPADLVGLAQVLGVDFSWDTKWSALCEMVKEEINKMPL